MAEKNQGPTPMETNEEPPLNQQAQSQAQPNTQGQTTGPSNSSANGARVAHPSVNSGGLSANGHNSNSHSRERLERPTHHMQANGPQGSARGGHHKTHANSSHSRGSRSPNIRHRRDQSHIDHDMDGSRSGGSSPARSGSVGRATNSSKNGNNSGLQNVAAAAAPISNPVPEQAPQLAPPAPNLNHNNAQYNWQATKTTVKDRLGFMFNNEVMADIHFIVGKGPNIQRIPAHRFVLSIGSAVFDAMFNGGMATTSEEIELPDVEPSAFLALLRFLYSDEVQIGPETVMTTLYTAKKYAVPALEKACVDFLKRNLSSDNAFMLLTQARLFDEPQLAALCLETIDKNTTEALGAEGFTDIDLDTLCVVLERDTLGIRECKLFSAVCRWSEAECLRESLSVTAENQRLVLGRALELIRFPLMTVEEFAMGAAQSGILHDREVVTLFLHFTVNPKPAVNFLDVPRCCLTGKEQVVSRFCQIESRWGYSGTSDRIRFMVNRRIFVVGFGLYGSIHGPSEYSVNIQIIHTDTGKVCGQNDSSFQCDGSNSTFRVMFKEPVEIHPNINYTACATLKGPDSYYGTKGLRKVTHESLTSGRVTFQFSYAAGNNNGTSVEDGQLPEIIFYT